MKVKQKLFIAVLIFLSQILIFFPAITWTHNQFNINTPFVDGIPLLLIIFVALAILAGVFSWVIPKFLSHKLLALFVVLTVLVFIQQNILVYDYGVLDGRNIQFDTIGMIGLIDLCVWGLGLLMWLFLSKPIIKQATLILCFSGLASVAVTINAMLFYDFAANARHLAITETNKFNYSKEKNVLVFLLDAFQTDLFMQIIEAEPQIKDEFQGFNFYPNTTAAYSKTYPTIPLLLTGKSYLKKEGIHEFLVNSYQSSFLTDLIDADWHVGLYPEINKLIPVNTNIMSNVINKSSWHQTIENYLLTLDLSLFRSVPHAIKPTIFNKGQMIIQKPTIRMIGQQKWLADQSTNNLKMPDKLGHKGLDFLENLQQHGSVLQDQHTFMFYHLLMPHRPFLLDRNLNQVNHKLEFNAYRDYAYASIKLMIAYLKELKSLGVYDQSTIMILADHGGGDYFSFEYDQKARSFNPIEEFGPEKASAKPLLLIKGFHQKNDFSVSNKPVSLIDVMPTLAGFSDIPVNTSGLPIDQIDENMPRERLYYHYYFTGFDSKYLQDFNIFKISGSVNDNNAWQHHGVLTFSGQSQEVNDTPYHLNQNLQFGTDIKQGADHSNKFIVSKNPHFYTSSLNLANNLTELEIPLAQPLIVGEFYQLELSLSSAEKEALLRIDFNDTWRVLINVDEAAFTYRLPIVFYGEESDQLQLKLEAIQSDTETQVAMNKLLLKKIKVHELAPSEEGLKLDFSKNIRTYHGHGFKPAKPWGRWTGKKQSTVLFMGSDDFCANNTINLNIIKFQKGVNPSKFKLFMNDQELSLMNTSPIQSGTQFSYECHESIDLHKKLIKLTLKTDTTVAPKDVSDSKDVRKLGLAIRSIVIKQKDFNK